MQTNLYPDRNPSPGNNLNLVLVSQSLFVSKCITINQILDNIKYFCAFQLMNGTSRVTTSRRSREASLPFFIVSSFVLSIKQIREIKQNRMTSPQESLQGKTVVILVKISFSLRSQNWMTEGREPPVYICLQFPDGRRRIGWQISSPL